MEQVLAPPKNTLDSLHEYKVNSIYSIVNNARNVDSAFINSILSYAVYSRNYWILDNIGQPFEKMKDKFTSAFMSDDINTAQNKFFALKVWNFISNNFDKISDNSIRIPAQNLVLNDYQYKASSEYRKGSFNSGSSSDPDEFKIAHASIIKRKDPNNPDGYIMHLVYRGTEFEHLGKYLTGPYLDMDAYYAHFKPLEKYIKAYVADPKNKITKLEVAGHSLGGAMVEQFLRNNPAESFPVPISGYTFGSPGSNKNKFLAIATHIWHHQIRGIQPVKKEEVKPDPRILNFYHTNDPVPKIGFAGYKKNGEIFNLFDNVQKNLNRVNEITNGPKPFIERFPIFGKMIENFKKLVKIKFNLNTIKEYVFSFHDSDRYIKNLKNTAQDMLEAYPQLSSVLEPNLKNLQEWTNQERRFVSFAIKYKEDLLSVIKDKFPDFDHQERQKVFYKLKELMFTDTIEESKLSKYNLVKGKPQFSNVTPFVDVPDSITTKINNMNTHLIAQLIAMREAESTSQIVSRKPI